MNKEAWHFYCWKEWNKRVFKRTLTASNMVGKRFYLDTFNKVRKEDNLTEEVEVNRKLYKFEKNKELWLVDESCVSLLPINPVTYEEGYIKKSDKTIHKLVTKSNSAKIVPVSGNSFRRFIDEWNPCEHSNERTRIFLNLLMVASKHKPIKIKLCSQPSSGKNANFTILSYITNDVKKVSKCTLAKLETVLYFNKVIIADEMTSLTKQQISDVEPIYLEIADESPDLEKHSMAIKSEMNLMNLEETSIIFPFNRVCDLSSGTTFFDDIWQNKEGFNSRYLSILLEGKVIEKRHKLNVKTASEIVDRNIAEMSAIAKELYYWIINIPKMRWDINTNLSSSFTDRRQFINFEGVIDCVDAYCDSQAEFDEWCSWIAEGIAKYNTMLGKTVYKPVVSEPVEIGDSEKCQFCQEPANKWHNAKPICINCKSVMEKSKVKLC